MQTGFPLPLIPTYLGAIAVAIWAWLALARGFFWRVDRATAAAAEKEFPGKLVAVMPARDEADVIGTVIPSLLRQTVEMPVILVDDNSVDGTVDIAWRAAQGAGKAEALIVVRGAPLPPGWSGKLWAVHQGIERARQFNAEWLLLADADVLHGSEAVARLGVIASEGNYDLVSFMVMLHCASLAEKLLIPAFVYFFFMLYPPAWIRDPRRSRAGAAGGCVLLRRAALDRAGGVEAVRGALIDDCSLARAVKQQGGAVWLGLTDESRSLRRYESFGAVGSMISRTAFHQLRHSSLLLLTTVAAMAVTFLTPPALLLTGARWPMILGAAAWAVMTVTYVPMVRYYGLSPLWASTLPAAAVFYLGATVHSAVRYWLGRGGQWKGRVQDVATRQISRRPGRNVIIPLQLITSRFRALVALGLTGWALALSLRSLLTSRPSSWTPLVSGILPPWWVVIINVVFYGAVAWMVVAFVLHPFRAAEKALLVASLSTVVLAPAAVLLPAMSGGIQVATTLLYLTAFLAALSVFLSFRKETAGASPDKQS